MVGAVSARRCSASTAISSHQRHHHQDHHEVDGLSLSVCWYLSFLLSLFLTILNDPTHFWLFGHALILLPPHRLRRYSSFLPLHDTSTRQALFERCRKVNETRRATISRLVKPLTTFAALQPSFAALQPARRRHQHHVKVVEFNLSTFSVDVFQQFYFLKTVKCNLQDI